MTLSVLRVLARQRNWLVAVSVVVAAHTTGTTLAEDSLPAALNGAASANDRSLARLEASLLRETTSLVKLRELRARGFASWREVAQQQVVVESLQADRQAVARYSEFIATLSEGANKAGLDRDADAAIGRKCSFHLNGISLRLAEALASASGDLEAAQIDVLREQHRLSVLEQLARAGGAGVSELQAARQSLKVAVALAERLAAERAIRVHACEKLRESMRELSATDWPECSTDGELQPTDLPSEIFAHDGTFGYLLQLRKRHYDSDAELATLAARRALHEELLRRLSVTQAFAIRRDNEIEQARLDVEFLKVRERAALERMKILRLEELQLVAQCSAGLSRDDLLNLTELTAGGAPRRIENLAGSLNAARWRVSDTVAVSSLEKVEGPLSKLQVPGTFLRVDSTFGEPRHIRFGEPQYSDYYEFGIRRADLSPAAKNDLRSGSIPWYLPGSPTNFK